MFKALTVINLPLLNDGEGQRFEPGDHITAQQMQDARQSEEDIQSLLDGDAISEDLEATINRDHWPQSADRLGYPITLHPDTGDVVKETGEDANA